MRQQIRPYLVFCLLALLSTPLLTQQDVDVQLPTNYIGEYTDSQERWLVAIYNHQAIMSSTDTTRGVGVPEPPGLPATWTAQWCPQVNPQGEWVGHPDAVRAGFNWRLHCPLRGWQGWFAEWFPCTEAAICLGWNADLFGTKATHNGNFRREDGGIKCNYSLRDFHIAEVFWDKSHPAYQLMYATGEYPCKPTTGVIEQEPIIPGTRVQRLEGTVWIEDVVRTAGRQIVEFVSGVRMTVGDEDRKWRRVVGSEPPPAPEPTPTPDPQPPVITPPPAPEICPAGQACREPCPVCQEPAPPTLAGILTAAPECSRWRAVVESAQASAGSPFTRQHRRQLVADCINAIDRVLHRSTAQEDTATLLSAFGDSTHDDCWMEPSGQWHCNEP